MRLSSRYISSLVLGLALGATHCDDEDEFTKTCRTLCQGLNCADGVDVEACTDEHRDRLDAAIDISDACGKRYQEMIECVVALNGCSGVANWESGRGLELDYPCRTETEDFLKACPDLWFKLMDNSK